MGADGLTNTSSCAPTPGHALTHRQTPCLPPGPQQPRCELRAARRAAAPWQEAGCGEMLPGAAGPELQRALSH